MRGIIARLLGQQNTQLGGGHWAATHLHKKGGGYRLLGYGVNEADRTDVAIYDDADGTVWVRNKAEFQDGRFTPIS